MIHGHIQNVLYPSFFCSNQFPQVVGVCSLICGIWLYLEKNDFVELTPSSFSALSAAGLCAFSGATIAIISAVGSIAVLIEGKCLLITVCSLFKYIFSFFEYFAFPCITSTIHQACDYLSRFVGKETARNLSLIDWKRCICVRYYSD